MAKDEIVAFPRRRAVFERRDLAVGAADADVEHPQLDVMRGVKARLRVIHELDLPGFRKYRYGFHG